MPGSPVAGPIPRPGGSRAPGPLGPMSDPGVKLEFLADTSHGPTLLLYGTDPEEVAKLRKALREVAGWPGRELALDDLPYIEAVDGCRLRAVCANRDIGVRPSSESPSFDWTLAPSSWSKVDRLLEPFSASTLEVGRPFEFLNPAFGPEVIYSTERSW